MTNEIDELLFLSNLYNTWPWYYDKEAIINIKNRIIHMQHRTITKIRLQQETQKKILPKKHTRTKKIHFL